MTTRQIEKNKISEDDKLTVYEELTKALSDDGRVDIYRDVYTESKTTGETYQTEHESIHHSGAHNKDYVGSETTTHLHEKPDGSIDAFDENNDKNKDSRDRKPYEREL